MWDQLTQLSLQAILDLYGFTVKVCVAGVTGEYDVVTDQLCQ
jgi:hypothetical protein